MAIENQYMPDFVTLPGETLVDVLEERGITQAELAERTGLAPKTINEISKGKAPLTHETALLLERALGVPAHFWNNRERQYREYVTSARERERLRGQIEWLKQFPVRAMVKLGWIADEKDRVDQVRQLLNFFGVASSDQWDTIWMQEGARASFRRSLRFASAPGPVAAWLRYGENSVAAGTYPPYNEARFREALREIRTMTRLAPETFLPRSTELCANAGIAFVPTPDLPKARICGATRWLTPRLALIQIGPRYRSDNHFWFTFFHEAGHVLLHGKRDVFLEGSDDTWEEAKEEESNRFASEFLIPERTLAGVARKHPISRAAVEELARRLEIAPGIVVGQLQFRGIIPHSHHNALKRRYDWSRVFAE